ncbi:TorD/DmsD family molecular chaperone [Campylobacter sp. TTU_617]|uniref:TorD/DmsD family molecular chaperone n=1 Tax=Campylobacter sp. TTU_617 TaxID=2768148 RepID=UPI001904DFBA|nr:molecular chaperone TorD family protein [Campylobacter sp. TTU_617]MBK1972215.1 molecular chaperone TorD family protein [Campylobacter sp. TTU_617]
MDLAKLRLARSLYYQCFGELFVFSFSKQRLAFLNDCLKMMKETSFDENLIDSFDILIENSKTKLNLFFDEYENLFLSLKNSIPITFSYIEEGFENSRALICVREILIKSKIRRNEKFFKESEDHIGFCFFLMSEFLKLEEDILAKELFEKVINQSIDEFIILILENEEAKLYKEVAYILSAFIEFERSCFGLGKNIRNTTKKVQNDLSRSEFLRREVNKKRRLGEKS